MRQPRKFYMPRTDREATILNMSFDGKSNREIARYFGLNAGVVSRIINRENIDYVCNADKLFVPCCHLDN